MVKEFCFFNKYVDSQYIERITHCKVLEQEVCVTPYIRLRRTQNGIKTYSVCYPSQFTSSYPDQCYGMWYKLNIDDYDMFSKCMPVEHIEQKIEICTIKVSNPNDLIIGKFDILCRKECSCFVCKSTKLNLLAYNNRRNYVNFCTKLLINLI